MNFCTACVRHAVETKVEHEKGVAERVQLI